MLKQNKIWLALALALVVPLGNADDLIDYAEIDTEEIIDDGLPIPSVYKEPDFNFLDCNGVEFNTKEIHNDERTGLTLSCSIQGIVNTKFSYNQNDVKKSPLELTQSEVDYLMQNLENIEPKAVYAYFVYLTMRMSEFSSLLNSKNN